MKKKNADNRLLIWNDQNRPSIIFFFITEWNITLILHLRLLLLLRTGFHLYQLFCCCLFFFAMFLFCLVLYVCCCVFRVRIRNETKKNWSQYLIQVVRWFLIVFVRSWTQKKNTSDHGNFTMIALKFKQKIIKKRTRWWRRRKLHETEFLLLLSSPFLLALLFFFWGINTGEIIDAQEWNGFKFKVD